MSVWRQLLQSLRGDAEVHARQQAGARTARWRQSIRHSYPRVAAPVLSRPTGPVAALSGRVPERSVLRGLAIATDETQRPGTLLELEVMTHPTPVQLVVRVEAVETLPEGAPARFDVLLQVCDLDPLALPALQSVLERERPFAQLC